MECKTDFKQTFQPVTFTITCQKPEDLVALWQRFNLTAEIAKVHGGCVEYSTYMGPLNTRGSQPQDTWQEVDNVVKKLGWR